MTRLTASLRPPRAANDNHGRVLPAPLAGDSAAERLCREMREHAVDLAVIRQVAEQNRAAKAASDILADV